MRHFLLEGTSETEGFQGHVRTIYPCRTACFECTLDLFPPQQAVPLCTIAETPRNAAHCILYAHLIEYPKHFPDAKADKEVSERWLESSMHLQMEMCTYMPFIGFPGPRMFPGCVAGVGRPRFVVSRSCCC